jgi:signal transduction histidine kinase
MSARTIPWIQQDLEWVVKRGPAELAQTAQLGLVLHNAEMIQEALRDYSESHDVKAVLFVDAANALVYSHGQSPLQPSELFGMEPRKTHDVGGDLVHWVSSEIEGVEVGKVAVVVSTSRIDESRLLTHDIFWLCILGCLFAVVLSLFFVNLYIGPLIKITEVALNEVRAFNRTLEARVNERTDMLVRSKRELESNLIKLRSTQRQLVNASRVAGMADVATSVLHNIGNVLNSVNVSCNILRDEFAASKTKQLARAADLLAQHKHALPAFFGRANLAERAATEAELTALQRNIDLIKTAVATHENLVKSDAPIEAIDVHEVITDAIHLDSVSSLEPKIALELHFGLLPEVYADRHKLLQIVTNLFSNARHAVLAAPGSERTITVTTTRFGDSAFTLEITDTGCGITPENLAQIFNQGFTTKSNGRGFGLHSAANAATEMGGTLVARSAGTGKGATLLLKMPLGALPVEGSKAPERAA